MKNNRPRLNLTTHVELFKNCYKEMMQLNKEHYEEISAHKKRNIPLNPEYERYFNLEDEGKLIYITLRHKGELMGYYIAFLMRDLHYKDCLRSFQDIFFISLKARGQNAFPLLIDAVEYEAKRRGALFITHGAKYIHQAHIVKPLLERGYIPFELHVGKWLC